MYIYNTEVIINQIKLHICVYVIYVYVCVYIYMHMYIYTYIDVYNIYI